MSVRWCCVKWVNDWKKNSPIIYLYEALSATQNYDTNTARAKLCFIVYRENAQSRIQMLYYIASLGTKHFI